MRTKNFIRRPRGGNTEKEVRLHIKQCEKQINYLKSIGQEPYLVDWYTYELQSSRNFLERLIKNKRKNSK